MRLGSAAAAIGAVALTGCGGSTPTFDYGKVTRIYDCYSEEWVTERPTITVTFIEGRKALVTSRGETALVEFKGTLLYEDFYRGDGVTLRLDPEAHVSGMRSGARGPCQY
jgi:hypothetical protein